MMGELTRDQFEEQLLNVHVESVEVRVKSMACLRNHDAAQRATIQQLEARVKEARQQESAWRIAFEGLERQHKALTDQIPADMIQADPILVERVTAATAMEEIGREQIADLQARVHELEEESRQWEKGSLVALLRENKALKALVAQLQGEA